MKKLAVIILVFMMFSCQKQEKEFNLLQKENALLAKKNDSLKSKLEIAEKAIVVLQNGSIWYNPEFDNIDFKKKGIKDPEKFITDELRSNPELIPIKVDILKEKVFININ
ncbi:MAG: hypothetical protein EOO44_08235 [Flavobacterium sp.]|nr:MAG: hypothetical protein EOO44_08235 [Flavobacterium sp.]